MQQIISFFEEMAKFVEMIIDITSKGVELITGYITMLPVIFVIPVSILIVIMVAKAVLGRA